MDVNSRLRNASIYVDAMGGDFAPIEIIKGSIDANDIVEAKVKLVGDKSRIEQILTSEKLDIQDIEIIPSTSVVNMEDSPSSVLKNKKDSSLYISSELASGSNDNAFLSAGNTGATMACALFNLKRIKGVLRPAIAITIPLGDSKVLLVDAGANVDSKAVYLSQFATMGKVYFENIYGVDSPRVGLINIGEEEKKGNETTIEAYGLLKDSGLNFIGNVEGRELFSGKADVVVCDGFIGNIILKSIEGMAKLFFKEVKNTMTSSILAKLGALTLKNSFMNMKKKFDYEEYGGALLLGVDGVAVISHGSSKAKAIKNAIIVAEQSIRKDIISKIKNEIAN